MLCMSVYGLYYNTFWNKHIILCEQFPFFLYYYLLYLAEIITCSYKLNIK